MAPTFNLQGSLTGSPTSLATVLISITAVLWIFQKLYRAITSPLRTLPGPFWSHFTHWPIKLASIRGQRIHYIHALHQRYGPIVRITPYEVNVSDAEAVRAIHKPGSGFNKAPWYKKFVSGGAAGVFDMDDPKEHAARRRLFARAFSKSEIRARWEGMVREKVELAKNEYIHVLESAMMGAGIRAELPLVAAIGRMIPHPTFQNTFNANDRLLSYGTRAVESAKAQGTGQGASIFAQLDPDEQKKTAFPLTDFDIRNEAGNFIVAGADTTAISMTYLTYAVLACAELRSELEAEVAGLPEGFGDRECEELPLLNAVVNETLRLYGAAPGSLPRTVPRGGTNLVGHYIPEGTVVTTQAWTLHRDEGLWPEAERFNPRRWLSLPPNTSPSSTNFSPFGAGTRICLGLHLALMELRLATAVFFRELRGAKLADKTTPESMGVVNFFLIRPKDDRCDIEL
ncbi:hypothetical protein GTA08_BOTSDO08954 [Botryosphaeria dothidea]|uniref:Cytochrome p450 protein n=1 Tax=Botryosphaeria dothidea TaxID=55169 RepID=A0A8H4IKG6_9PEZI|nr:hypothetical protein GTA08_BOTSDO08954 [Botryosphaeria dothidea]